MGFTFTALAYLAYSSIEAVDHHAATNDILMTLYRSLPNITQTTEEEQLFLLTGHSILSLLFATFGAFVARYYYEMRDSDEERRQSSDSNLKI